MFTVLSSWQSHCESSPGSSDECRICPLVKHMALLSARTMPQQLHHQAVKTKLNYNQINNM